MNKSKKIMLTVGGTLAYSLPVIAVSADMSDFVSENPFEWSALSGDHLQTVKASEVGMKMSSGACGEGKCGSSMMTGSENKTVEGKCAGNKPMPKSKTALPKKDKAMEGKCGEGKCGSAM